MSQSNAREHSEQQRLRHNKAYAAGARPHAGTSDPLVRYLVDWRLKEAVRRVTVSASSRLNIGSSVLLMCAGEGIEGSLLCDLGYSHVTVSDISEVAVKLAVSRDPRLNGLALNAERTGLPDGSYDLVVVQDGLHHLQNPVGGFTEMLRLARVAAVFLEPHDALVGRSIGTTWERHDDAVNFVFRWNRWLVQQVASSYLGPNSFRSESFSFWHHNGVLEKIARAVGGGTKGLALVKGMKAVMDFLASGSGNWFCGAIVKSDRPV